MSGFDIFDDDSVLEIDPFDPFGKTKAEEERAARLEENAESTVQPGKVSVKTFGEKLAEDEESGASIRIDDGEVQGTASEEEGGGSFHIRASKINADTGTALGPVKLSAHGPEADGFVSASDQKKGIGGHLDVAGVDAQVGDDGTHVKGGVSLGLGLGAEFATGDDSDGDGYGEMGIRGEFGPFSGSVRFEPEAAYDGAADLAEAAPGLAQDFADDPAGTLQGLQDAIDEDADQRVENASALRSVRDELGDALGSATDPLGGIAGGVRGDLSADGTGGSLTDSFGELLSDAPVTASGPDEYEVTPQADESLVAPPEYLDPGPILEVPLESDGPTTPGPVEDTFTSPEPMDGAAEYEMPLAVDSPMDEPTSVEPTYVEPTPADTYVEPTYVEPTPADTYADDPQLDY